MKIGKFLVALFLLVGLLTAFGCSEEITNPSEEVPPSTPEEAEPFMTVPSWLQGYWAVMEYNDIVSQTLFMDAKIDDLNFPDDPYVSTGFYANELGLDLTIISASSNTFSFRLSKTVNGVTAIDNLFTFTKNSDDQITYFKSTNGFTIADNLTLHRIKYKITFNPNGGTITSPNSTKIIYRGEPYGSLPVVSRNGYTLSGWSLERDGSESLITAETIATIESDTTLYAIWASNTFTLSFESQADDIDDPDDKLLVYDTEYGYLPYLTRSGYYFTGWWTGPNQTGVKIAINTIVNLTEDQILYAGWALQHTVTFDSQGGSSPSPESIIVGEGLMYGSLPTTSLEGKFFSGWWTGTEGTIEQITETSIVTITTDQTLYAKWDYFPVGSSGPAGGLVFYDKGSFSDGWQYLEAAPAGWSGTPADPEYKFGHYRTTSDGTNLVVGTQEAIGTGKANTIALVSAMGDTTYGYYSGPAKEMYAAKVCADYRGGGFDDWFLPSKDELELMYLNLHQKSLGGFSDNSSYYFNNNVYLSSSESGNAFAWTYEFHEYYPYAAYTRSGDFRVRPARAF